jgi:hypothetical protein
LRNLGANSGNSAAKIPLDDGTVAEVPVFIDVPHCIKNMSNALQKYTIDFADGDERLLASWSDVTQCAAVELEKPQQLRLVPKIGVSHVQLSVGKKMSVRLAAQIFSRTMAHAIAVYAEHGILTSATARGTAKFCELVNALFDLTNNVSPLFAINQENLQLKLQEIDGWIAWLGSLRFISSDGKAYHGLKFHQGRQLSLRSLQEVCKKLLGSGTCAVVCSRSFTQDHVENGFSCIRRRGGFNDRPECREAAAAFRWMAVNQLLGICFEFEQL